MGDVLAPLEKLQVQLEADGAIKMGCPGERFAELIAKKLKDKKSPYVFKAIDGVVMVVSSIPAPRVALTNDNEHVADTQASLV